MENKYKEAKKNFRVKLWYMIFFHDFSLTDISMMCDREISEWSIWIPEPNLSGYGVEQE